MASVTSVSRRRPTQVGHRFQADIDGIYQGLDGSFIGDVDALF